MSVFFLCLFYLSNSNFQLIKQQHVRLLISLLMSFKGAKIKQNTAALQPLERQFSQYDNENATAPCSELYKKILTLRHQYNKFTSEKIVHVYETTIFRIWGVGRSDIDRFPSLMRTKK